ncbi:NAC domain containing protein 52-like protein [Tanacetum coccineum]
MSNVAKIVAAITLYADHTHWRRWIEICFTVLCVVEKDVFVLSNFQNSGLEPPLGDRYARFLEEEWANDATLLVPREEAEDDITHDMTAGEERRAYTNDIVQIKLPTSASFLSKNRPNEFCEPVVLCLSCLCLMVLNIKSFGYCKDPQKISSTSTKVTSTLIDDRYAWRKYGQKLILNAKYQKVNFSI